MRQLGLCPDSVAAMDQYGSVIFQRLAALAAQQLPEPSGCKARHGSNIPKHQDFETNWKIIGIVEASIRYINPLDMIQVGV